ncbi:hypothetical protein D8674_021247 [Pyrus ussuriensis x Pyrus communis]|uniref:Uncharacterized protein n=1 Tax=Pyrus ussuriensis x Pyrus communis TaxID=2448454 RepID=A0A5N5GGJ1_9ROSA|nr:hypothetical protein D8674_021203 [Pyrus ussuriensis x Pyrus communis]KAB2614659.1 hypothetical protein D8674_021247 [Pyrus ussuriensis x Pyrus communis]
MPKSYTKHPLNPSPNSPPSRFLGTLSRRTPRAKCVIVHKPARSRGMPKPFWQAALHFPPMKNLFHGIQVPRFHTHIAVSSFGDQRPHYRARSARRDVSRSHRDVKIRKQE